jgi:hypothetical protein
LCTCALVLVEKLSKSTQLIMAQLVVPARGPTDALNINKPHLNRP